MLCDVRRRRRRRRRHRRWAHAPVIHAASHFDHKKRVAWVPISMHTCGSFFYNYGAPLGGPSGRRSSAINLRSLFQTLAKIYCVYLVNPVWSGVTFMPFVLCCDCLWSTCSVLANRSYMYSGYQSHAPSNDFFPFRKLCFGGRQSNARLLPNRSPAAWGTQESPLGA